jgi:hypothetical protein
LDSDAFLVVVTLGFYRATRTPTWANPHPPTRVGVLAGQGRGFVGFAGFCGFNGFKKPAPGSEDMKQKYIAENIHETNLI